MPRRAVGVSATIVVVAGLVAVGVFVWPGLPDGVSPYSEFRPTLQSPSEVTELLGDPDAIERNCWFYLDRSGIDELRVCFGPKARVAWSSISDRGSNPGRFSGSDRSNEQIVYPDDSGQVVEFAEFAIVRPQDWSSWTLYGGLKGSGLQIVSGQVREPASRGEVDPVKAMAGDQVAVTLVPAGRLSEGDDVVAIGRDDLMTEGAEVPRGRAIVDRLLCRDGSCLYLHVEFANRQPSDNLLQQVNRLVATVERIRA